MGSDRQFIPASEFCLAVKDGTHDSPKPVESGRFLVTSRHITSGRLDLASAYRIAQSDFEQINQRSRVDRWDVLISMIGTVGEPCLIAEEPNFAIKNVGLFKSRSELHGKWLYYYLRSAAAQQKIHELSRGTTQSYVPLGALRNLPVPVPADARELAAIAHILGSLDDKIELNRKLNKTLEDMARALFQSWFVDFDPVRAKALGLQPSGMDADTQKLFPDGFEMSELGEIPRGWRVARLGEVANQIRSTVNPSDVSSETPYIGLEHMPQRSITLGTWDTAAQAQSQKSRFKQGQILFGKLRPYFHKVGVAALDGVCSTDIVVVDAKQDAWFAFILGHLSSNAFVAFTNAGSDGTKMPRTSWERMASYQVVLPPIACAKALGVIVQPFIDQIRSNIFESRVTAEVRDALLPRLLSGEIPIKNAERFIASQG